jgi:type II secretory pathway pseudopilin PulG
LVEIMMVVLIISVLAMLSLPAFQRVRRKARTAAVANDFRVFGAAFDTYAHETGGWPPNSAAGVVPPLMAGRINAAAFTRTTPIGGKYNWEYNRTHVGVVYKAAISISGTAAAPLTFDLAQYTDIEKTFDPTLDWYAGTFHLGTGNIPLYIITP